MSTFVNYSGWSNAATSAVASDQFLIRRGAEVKSMTYEQLFTSAGMGNVSSGETESVDGELALFGGTSGKAVKRAAGTGAAMLTDGVLTVADEVILDENGNVGVGVTPSGWADTISAVEFPCGSAVAGSNASADMLVTSNAYINTDGDWKRKTTAAATMYEQHIGTHVWYTAASGAAGSTLTWVQAMALNSSGDLTIGGGNATKASGTAWANPSDQRLKENIRSYQKGLAELLQIKIREWDYNGKGRTTAGMRGMGVIADEIMSVLPDTVSEYTAKLDPTDTEEVPIKKVDPSEITWLLVTSLQQLAERLEALEAK